MAKNRNYVPHNEHRHIETRHTESDWENYLWKLSKTVGDACDRFFVSRGMPPGSVEVRTEAWRRRHEIVSFADGSIRDEKSAMKSQGESASKSCQESPTKSPVREELSPNELNLARYRAAR
jgi:hypothetical protein